MPPDREECGTGPPEARRGRCKGFTNGKIQPFRILQAGIDSCLSRHTFAGGTDTRTACGQRHGRPARCRAACGRVVCQRGVLHAFRPRDGDVARTDATGRRDVLREQPPQVGRLSSELHPLLRLHGRLHLSAGHGRASLHVAHGTVARGCPAGRAVLRLCGRFGHPIHGVRIL